MTNRLAASQSLYLRKHAENPIDWWPWCDQALVVARQENKPIFLSIGYSSCHWCTVMEGEAFSNSAIATYMNRYFLPIKVDREERPDIDSIYMQALHMMVGQGGWPLNVFLSPEDLVPFYGGTYFPVEPRYGRPGFLQVLQTLRNLYDTEKDKVNAVKSQILEGLQQGTLLPVTHNLSQSLLRQGLAACTQVLVPTPGQGNRFPMIPYALTALRAVPLEASGDLDGQQVCRQRALDLALGGIYDHVGGGFHRYTVDPTWTVPHFEKMLYDNGLIVEFLADGWAAGIQAPALERAIAGTVHWLTREMLAPTGYFYAAQDADSFVTPEATEPEEGAFYVWDYEQLQGTLTAAELSALAQQFTVTAQGNFEGTNVLQRDHPDALPAPVVSALDQLFAVRYGQQPGALSTFPPAVDAQTAKTADWPGRIPPVTDTKMIVAWNSLMISGLARAAAVLDRADYLALAIQVAQFILDHQWVEGRLQRLNYEGTPAILAQAEDYALLIKALMDIQQACLAFEAFQTQAQAWLERAVAVQAEFDEGLWSLETGGYFNTAGSDDLLVRERSYQDSAIPSANGVAISTLIRLALLTEDLTYLDRAEQALQCFSLVLEQFPRACPSLLQALDWYHHHTLIRTSAGRLPPLLKTYLPTAVVKLATDLPAGIIGLVCQGLTCNEPATSEAQLREQITRSQQRTHATNP
jgi:uncharacterized protein YyaL (SSP411 family)